MSIFSDDFIASALLGLTGPIGDVLESPSVRAEEADPDMRPSQVLKERVGILMGQAGDAFGELLGRTRGDRLVSDDDVAELAARYGLDEDATVRLSGLKDALNETTRKFAGKRGAVVPAEVVVEAAEKFYPPELKNKYSDVIKSSKELIKSLGSEVADIPVIGQQGGALARRVLRGSVEGEGSSRLRGDDDIFDAQFREATAGELEAPEQKMIEDKTVRTAAGEAAEEVAEESAEGGGTWIGRLVRNNPKLAAALGIGSAVLGYNLLTNEGEEAEAPAERGLPEVDMPSFEEFNRGSRSAPQRMRQRRQAQPERVSPEQLRIQEIYRQLDELQKGLRR